MLKLAAGMGLALALAGISSASMAAIGPDARACSGGRTPALLIQIDGFRERRGRVRINVYDDPAKFLTPGEYVRQIDLAVTRRGAMPVCVALPRAGRYAVAVRHDSDGDGNDWQDGGGFSNNPRLTLASLRPSYEAAAFAAGRGVTRKLVTLNYRFGLSVRPVRG